MRQRFIVQVDDDPKHTTKTTQEFLKVKKVEYSAMAMSISWFQPDWACISLAEDKGLAKHQKGGNPVFGDVKDAKDSQQI